jgi:hypothetical protein
VWWVERTGVTRKEKTVESHAPLSHEYYSIIWSTPEI